MNMMCLVIHSGSRKIATKSGIASIIAIIGVICFLTGSAYSQDGEALFKKTCTACHTIGSGRIVGPDLKGITEKRKEEWLIQWIKASQALVKSGDADAIAIFEEFNKIMMPDNNLPDTDIKAIISYIKTASGGGSATAAADSTVATAPIVATAAINTATATASDVLYGQQLFDGSVRMANGGAACVSCHNVSSNRIIPGGMLAKDLTTAHSRLGGDVGISGILNAPPFPAMTETYKNKAMTEKEIFALASFLATVEKESTSVGQQQLLAANPLLLYGSLGFVIWVGIILMIWGSRKRNTVKLKIFERQVKSI